MFDDIVNAECARGVYRTSTGSQRFAGIFKCKDCKGDPVSRCSCRESSAIRFLSFLSCTLSFQSGFCLTFLFVSCGLFISWVLEIVVAEWNFFVLQSFFHPTFSEYYISKRSYCNFTRLFSSWILLIACSWEYVIELLPIFGPILIMVYSSFGHIKEHLTIYSSWGVYKAVLEYFKYQFKKDWV